MSTHEDHRPFDRETADLLLGGDPSARRAHPALSAVLTAAATPARERTAGARMAGGATAGGATAGGATAGEEAAVAAFVAARRTPPRFRRIRMLLTVKVVACVAALGAGGVAVAAGTGTLPGPLHQPAEHHSAPPAPPAPPVPPFSHSPKPSPPASATPRPSRPAAPADRCPKWTPGPADERGHAADRFCTDPRKAKGNRPSGSVRPSGSGNAGPHQANLPSGAPDPTRPGR